MAFDIDLGDVERRSPLFRQKHVETAHWHMNFPKAPVSLLRDRD